MHAVEDYIVSRYQMYMQVYSPSPRGMEVKEIIYWDALRLATTWESNPLRHRNVLKPFFEGTCGLLEDYLRLDDGVLNTISLTGY